MRSWTLAAAFVFGLVAPPVATPTEAGTAIRMAVAELTQQADTIVEGRILDAHSGRAAEGGLIYTDYTVSVTRPLAGVQSEWLALRLPGGELEEGIAMVIPGMPQLAVGEDVLLFLTEPGKTGLRMPIGLSQGKFRVVTELASGAKTLVRSQAGLEYFDPASGAIAPADGRVRYDYALTLATVHAALAKKQAAEQGGR